jgi:hypothetical protein
MVERHPHTVVLRLYSAPTQDSNGNLIGTTYTEESVECRVKPTSERVTYDENGAAVNCSFTIALPETVVSDYTNGEVEFNSTVYKVLRFERYQARSKIWI